MTIEMQKALERELADAKAIADVARRHEALETVLCHELAALIDCQRKTAERVKELVAQADGARQRVRGAKTMLAVLRYVAAMGGGAAVVKLLACAN